MDVSGEVADLMVKESIQITEESIKLLAAGAKNLTAFLVALAQGNKKLSGKTNMGRLLRDGKELKVFRIKESDLEWRSAAPARSPDGCGSRCPLSPGAWRHSPGFP